MKNTTQKDQIFAKKSLLGAIYSQTFVMVTGNIALAAVSFWLYKAYLPTDIMLMFCIGVIIPNLCRVGMYFYYKKLGFRHLNRYHHWYLQYLFAFAGGATWGSWGWYILSHLSYAESLIIIINLSGLCAGSVGTLSSSRKAQLFFTVPTLFPLAIHEFFFAPPGDIAIALGIVTTLYFASLTLSASRIYNTLYNSVLLAVTNERLANQLYKFSNTDGLTGLANRRHFDSTLDKLWNFSRRHPLKLSLLLFDIDWFKRYNDSLGHLAGDECLRVVAHCTQSFFSRQEDFVARYGGEEFVVLLPGIDEKSAKDLADRFCEYIYDRNIPHPDSQKYDRLTVSSGTVTMHPKLTKEPADLLELADKALYQAKKDGRNRAAQITLESIQPKLAEGEMINPVDQKPPYNQDLPKH